MTIHFGDIMDGINVDGELFGGDRRGAPNPPGGPPQKIILGTDEEILSIEYSRPQHSYWNKYCFCKFTIFTNQKMYGPYAKESLHCKSTIIRNDIPSGMSFRQFLQLYSSTYKPHPGDNYEMITLRAP